MTKKQAASKGKKTGGRARAGQIPPLVFYACPGQELALLSPAGGTSAFSEMFYRTVRICAGDAWDALGGSQLHGHLFIEAGTTYARAAVPEEVEDRVRQGLAESVTRVIRGEPGGGEIVYGDAAGECRFRVSFQASPFGLAGGAGRRAGDGPRSGFAEAAEVSDSEPGPAAEHPCRDVRGVVQPGQEPPPIGLQEVSQARAQVERLQETVVERIQGLLDSLGGRRGESEEANKQIAKDVYDLARRTGTQLVYEGQPARIHWAGRVFHVRTTDSTRKPLGSSAKFPQLTAEAKQVGPEEEIRAPDASVDVGSVQGTAKKKGRPPRQ